MNFRGRAEGWSRAAVRLAADIWSNHPGLVVAVPIGALAGWFGALSGFLIGFMFDRLVMQNRVDRATAAYLENPGPSDFVECEPGAAAASALFLLVISADRPKGRRDGELAVSRAAALAVDALGASAASLPDFEEYVRVAACRLDRLNPDLLSESLCSRRRGKLDAAALSAGFESAAAGRAGRLLAARIAAAAAPERRATVPAEDDPYALLGVAEDTPVEEVKNVFRRLAVQFHPDALSGLGEERERKAAEAFMKIERAYREVVKRGARRA